MSVVEPGMSWTAVLPVKELAIAKSRLGAGPEARAGLALAMARDVAAAAASCPAVNAVLVVTDDPLVADKVPADRVEPDVPRAGLSAAVAHGASAALSRWPRAGVVVLAADLPALTSTALSEVLAALVDGRGVVADSAGTGTVLLATRPGTALAPSYEGASFAAHRAGGAVDLTAVAAAGVRRDVDTVEDLAAALVLGVGPATWDSVREHRASWQAAGLL
ncbi:MAG: 2-phospho-L-lactate guanylyltransferase [Mycobacteriales bacterium]